MGYFMTTEHIQKKQPSEYAIDFVKKWADKRLSGNDNSTSSGNSNKRRFGFTDKKYLAAIFCNLYPNTAKLRDIANIAGVSFDVIRKWRTEDKFRSVSIEEGIALGDEIARMMNKYIEEGNYIYSNLLLDIASAFDSPTYDAVRDLIIQKFHEDGEKKFSATVLLLSKQKREMSICWDNEELKKIEKRNLPITKEVIKGSIDLLTDLQTAQKFGESELQEMRDNLKDQIVRVLDILAS